MAQKSDSAGPTQTTEMENLVSDDNFRSTDATCGTTEGSELPTVNERQQNSGRSRRIIVVVIVVLSIACLLIGIALLIKSNSRCMRERERAEISLPSSKLCAPSEEARRVRLFDLLGNVQRRFFEFHPNAIALDLSASLHKIKLTFQAYDSNPAAIKNRTDIAFKLMTQIKNIAGIHASKLKSRERKLVSQMAFYLQHVFGQPYDGNYYTGGWMMGPNFFCWQPMCSLGAEMAGHLPLFAPKTLDNIERLENIFEGYNRTILQYIENLKLGVKAGMVRSVEECQAGLDAFRGSYRQIYLKNETGVLDEPFATVVTQPGYFTKLSNISKMRWLNKTGKSVQDTLRESLVNNFGLPMRKLLSYLENDYSRHCVPSNVSSGLATRPLSHVYVDGVATTLTTKRLPTGEKLNGTKTYESMMSYFTTTDITPDEVYQKGWEIVKKTYPQVIAIAKQITGLNDTDAAVAKFRLTLKSQRMYFNDAPLPKNESGPEAFRKCSSVQGAKKHCPVRWETLQKWFKISREIMSLLDPKTIDMFYFTGEKRTTPNCPVNFKPDFNPSTAAQSYEASDANCTKPCTYNVPFFLKNMGPSFTEWSANAHEARPGHHTQIQGYQENFLDSCGGVSAWLNQVARFDAFSEGWGLYAEALIGENTDTYDGKPLIKYGWLKWQIWRALRLIVDTGFHSKGLTRREALNLFDKYAWDNSDIPEKELTRYQSGPGQATAYMIGQLTITNLRRYANEKLGKKFDLKDFHFQVLSQGSAPLSFIISHIEHYVKCKLDSTRPGCEAALAPAPSTGQKIFYRRTLEGTTVSLPHFSYQPRGYL